MKWLLGLLLIINVAFFSFMQWGGVLTNEGKNVQSQPLLSAEKIKLLTVSAPAAVQSTTASACMEWGEFSGAELARANSALSALKLGNNLTQRQVEHTIGYWVYLPPLKNSAEVEKKVAQIKELGMEEYFVVSDAGKWHNAISLGVFKTEAAAHKFLDDIVGKGLKAAKAGERMSKHAFTVFVLKNPDAALTAKMALLQKDYADSELKAVACTN
ncbi:MAG: SPOR domain-containing protein [Nitrosomonadales bacterium]|nr:SPOR domain-containing protein [Nitrosomonadales bacterium]